MTVTFVPFLSLDTRKNNFLTSRNADSAVCVFFSPLCFILALCQHLSYLPLDLQINAFDPAALLCLLASSATREAAVANMTHVHCAMKNSSKGGQVLRRVRLRFQMNPLKVTLMTICRPHTQTHSEWTFTHIAHICTKRRTHSQVRVLTSFTINAIDKLEQEVKVLRGDTWTASGLETRFRPLFFTGFELLLFQLLYQTFLSHYAQLLQEN